MAQPTGRPNGRPAKPVEVKRATGNPGHRPLPNAPLPGQGIPATNDTIPKPIRPLGTEGKKLWSLLWNAGKQHLSPQSDTPIMMMLCEAADELEYIRKEFKSGRVSRFYLMSNGAEAPHPLMKERKDLLTQSTAWLSQLGFSPARAPVKLTPSTEPSATPR